MQLRKTSANVCELDESDAEYGFQDPSDTRFRKSICLSTVVDVLDEPVVAPLLPTISLLFFPKTLREPTGASRG